MPAVYQDSFSTGKLDPKRWTQTQVKKHQLEFIPGAPPAKTSAVAITLRDGDTGLSCDQPCQRAEIRQHGELRPEHEDEFWQSFSFRTRGDYPTTGSVRTVIGQWKAPGDNSPFLAQRYDDGVFHITVQDGGNRHVVATASGDPIEMEDYQKMVARLANPSGFGRAAIIAAKALEDLGSQFPALADGDGLGNAAACLLKLVDARDDLDADTARHLAELMHKFRYINDLEQFLGDTNVTVENPENRLLPDPRDRWVRMAFRIKAGRPDNIFGPRREGEIDVYADGDLICKVRGNLGGRIIWPMERQHIYFKYGLYRDVIPGTVHTDIDDFRQGNLQGDVM